MKRNNTLNNKMNKKGQMTIFIVIGILVVLSLIVFFAMFKDDLGFNVKFASKLDEDTQAINGYVEYCMENVSLPGIYLLSFNGGYLYNFQYVLPTDEVAIAYHLRENNKTGMSIKFMQDELSYFIESTIFQCLSSIDEVNMYNLTFQDPEVTTLIKDKSIVVDMNLPIRSAVGNKELTLDEFSIEIPIELRRLINIKDDIINTIVEKGSISYEELSELDANIPVMPYDSDRTTYQLKIDNLPYNELIFNFVVYKKIEVKDFFDVPILPPFKLKVGEEFTYNVYTYGESGPLTFYDDSILFNINRNTGRIQFTPLSTDIGEHNITIDISDGIYSIKRELFLQIDE